MSAIQPKLEPSGLIVKRELDVTSEDVGQTTPSPPAKKAKATRQPSRTPAKSKKTASTDSDAADDHEPFPAAQSISPQKASKGIPGGFTSEQRAAMVEELIAAGLSSIGVRNFAAKYSGTDRQVYNLFQGGKPGNLRGKLVHFAGTYKQ